MAFYISKKSEKMCSLFCDNCEMDATTCLDETKFNLEILFSFECIKVFSANGTVGFCLF